MKELTGSEIILNVLQSQGVEIAFGHPGGAILPFYDTLYSSSLKHHLARHEQAAVHMAQGYTRSTGKVGVVVVTSGPGACNTITGLVDAKIDSMPVLVISGQVPRNLIAKDGFQEADTVGIALSATKHCDLVWRIEDLEKTLLDAFYITQEGRPGPVLVDIPKDVLLESTSYPKYSPEQIVPPREIVSGEFEDAARALCEAKKPLVYYGGGVINADASQELTRLIRVLGAPATSTLMGLGAFPGQDPLFVGMLGMHGLYAANMAMYESDCVLAAGVRFDDRVTGKLESFAPHAKFIHIDADASEIDKNRKADWPLLGDAKPILQKLTEEVERYLEEGHGSRAKNLAGWWDSVRSWQEKQPLRYTKRKGVIKPQQLVQEIHRQTGGNAIVASDVGQHQMWIAQYYTFERPREWLNSGGLGTMGYGLPAAIGAKIGNPEREVIAMIGDGAFQMTMQEMAALMQDQVPVKVAIFNNHFLGMVRQWQDLFYEKRFMETDLSLSPDYVKLAEAYGVTSARVKEPDDLEAAVERMLSHEGAYLLDVVLDHEEHVYPMVPSGGASHEMLVQPDSADYLD